jgi:DNA helicase-2/ATP-dependent DNA helicase PcrA
MVDEYQDTNTAQFELIRMLASGYNELGEREYNLCVVGDDDQSIYKFRGANIRNILNFEHAFPNTKVIKLEQNYRSTKSILNAANEIIRNNIGRKAKALWTKNEDGETLRYNLFETDYDEAESIATEIKRIVDSGKACYNDFAVLYRMNAQSRIFEEKLVLRNIPYKIIGSINFYARKEIKDLLAYLKTIDNGLDDMAVKRIINVPRRGIGLVSIDRIESYAFDNGLSFYETLVRCGQIPGLERISSKIMPFVSLIEGLRANLEKGNYSLKELIDDILSLTGYLKELEEEDSDESRERISNIDEFINKAVTYEENAGEQSTLSGFLEEVALVSDIDSLDESSDRVVLMTLHSAKGLEFPYVYMCGMEEGIFPGYQAIYAQNPQEEIEEERRLCYVGFTRAKRRLALSAAKRRMFRGELQFSKPSRFIQEIPPNLLEAGMDPGRGMSGVSGNGTGGAAGRNMTDTVGNGIAGSFGRDISYLLPEAKDIAGSNMGTLDYGVGDTVRHARFGTGIVTNITKGGKDYEVTVDFPRFGTKKLLSSFAKLVRVD